MLRNRSEFEKAKTYQSTTTYPNNAFAKDLKQIAELITADSDTKIYYAGMTGFDTHANQKNTQTRLLKNYSESVTALLTVKRQCLKLISVEATLLIDAIE